MPRTRVSCGRRERNPELCTPCWVCQREAEVGQGSGGGGVLASCLLPAVRTARTPPEGSPADPRTFCQPRSEGLLVLSLTALGAGL